MCRVPPTKQTNKERGGSRTRSLYCVCVLKLSNHSPLYRREWGVWKRGCTVPRHVSVGPATVVTVPSKTSITEIRTAPVAPRQ